MNTKNFPAFEVAVEGFLLSKSANGLSPNTIRNYKKELSRFGQFVQNKKINEISSQAIQEYFVFLKDDFRITSVGSTKIKPRKMSQKSLRNAWGTLSSFWNWTCKEFIIANPFVLSPIRATTKPILPLSSFEVERIIKASETSSKQPRNKKAYVSRRCTGRRDKAIILLLLDTGIRVSELCEIDLNNVDINIGRILVTGKGNKKRYVYIGKICKQALWRYILERFPDGKPIIEEPLFLSQDNIHKLTRHGVLQLVKRLGEKAGLNNVHPHKFRHTFAIQFLRNGGNVFELQQLLGHTDLDMVKNYVRLAQIDLESVARRSSPVDNWRIS